MDFVDGTGIWTVGQGGAPPVPPEPPAPPIVVTVGGGSPLARLRRLALWRRMWGEFVPEGEIQEQVDTPFFTDATQERLRRIAEDDEEIIRLL